MPFHYLDGQPCPKAPDGHFMVLVQPQKIVVCQDCKQTEKQLAAQHPELDSRNTTEEQS